MTRVTCIVYQFPQLSESYAHTEFLALAPSYELDLISIRPPNEPGAHDIPFIQLADPKDIFERVRDFKPDVIHTHWLGRELDIVTDLARRLSTPFSVRAHSFDVLWPRPSRKGLRRVFPARDISPAIRRNLRMLQSDLCLGVLSFPFAIPRLVRAGIPEQKLTPCWPVSNYEAFHDESPNGRSIFNGGACLPKKDFASYLHLAAGSPGFDFNLYPVGYQRKALETLNDSLGKPATIHDSVQYKEMPALYKRHEWLIYTANRKIGTVGWPVCVAEAQAAGVGICMPNLRPDIKEFVGPGGFVYDTFDEVRDIIAQPYPEEMRRAGFEHARRSDVRAHLSRLTDLWR